MGSITDAIALAFRDFVTEGVASSGIHEPLKAEVRALGPLIEAAIGNAGLGALVSFTKATKTLLDADLAHPADTVALVYADATDANNDLFVKTGASGTGSWVNSGALHQIVAGLVQPYVSDAEAARDEVRAALLELGPEIRALSASEVQLAKFAEDSGTVAPSVYDDFSFDAGTSYTIRTIVRADGRRYFNIYAGAGALFNTVFDLEDGVVSSTGAGNTASIIPLGRDFFFVTVTCVATASASANVQFRFFPTVIPAIYTGDGSSGVWLPFVSLRVTGSTTELFASTDVTNAAFSVQQATVANAILSDPPAVSQLVSRVDAIETKPQLLAASDLISEIGYPAILPRVVVEGDSIMQANASPITGSEFGLRDARGEINWAFARFPYFTCDQWGDTSDAVNYSSGCIVAVGGNTAQDVIDRMNIVSNLAGDVLALAIGINDINGGALASEVMPKIIMICEHYTSLGWRVALANLRPVGNYLLTDWSTGSQRYSQRIALNNLIREYAEATPNVQLVDLAAAYEDPENPERPIAGDTYDELHPSRTGACCKGGPAWEAVFRKMFKPLVKALPVGRNLIPQGNFAGTGGDVTPSHGVTGEMATGWIADRTFGNATIVCSKNSNDQQVFTFTPGGTSAALLQISRQFGGMPLQAGKWYQSWLHVTLEDVVGWRSIRFQVGANMDGFGPFDGSVYTAQIDRGGSFWLPTFHHMADVGGETAQLLIHAVVQDDVDHTLTMTLHGLFCVEVPDPRPLHGFQAY